jgi:hypothetical protein
MLGKPTKGIQEVIAHFGKLKFTLEFKYDGERAQVLTPYSHSLIRSGSELLSTTCPHVYVYLLTC